MTTCIIYLKKGQFVPPHPCGGKFWSRFPFTV